MSPAEFTSRGEAFRERLDRIKLVTAVPDYGWYPYESLSSLPILAELLRDDLAEVLRLLQVEPMADLGCGDGDLAMFFASLGSDVDAIDHGESNFNQMRGVHLLRRELGNQVLIHDIDLDGQFHLPREQYGLIAFLGTLYHLKNTFYVLEELAKRTAYCLLSTRIAQKTYTGALIEGEPVAYLLDAREANNDPTNFWIFSHAGLLRLLDRTGWLVCAQKRSGCLVDSNPVDPAKDERISLLLKSRVRYPDLHVRALEGWYPPESDSWRWTAKRFSIEVVLPRDRVIREFALRVVLPESVLAVSPLVLIRCVCERETVGTITIESAGAIEFRGTFPEAALARPAIQLQFDIESIFAAEGDRRELGVLVPLLDRSSVATNRLPFRIS